MAAPTHLAHVTGAATQTLPAPLNGAATQTLPAQQRGAATQTVATAKAPAFMTDAAAARRAELQRLANALVEVNLEARQLRSEIDSQPKKPPSDMPSPGAIKRLEAARQLHNATQPPRPRSLPPSPIVQPRFAPAPAAAPAPAPAPATAKPAAAPAPAPPPAAAKPAAATKPAATAHQPLFFVALGKPLAVAPDAAGDDEAATLRAQLSLVHEKGVALRAQLVREQAARAGLERDLATSRAALEQSRAANAVLQAALDESKAALRRLGERVEASE